MNAGAIAGIVIVVIVAVAGIVGFIFWFLKAKKADTDLMGPPKSDLHAKKGLLANTSGKKGVNRGSVSMISSGSNEKLKTSSSALVLNDI